MPKTVHLKRHILIEQRGKKRRLIVDWHIDILALAFLLESSTFADICRMQQTIC